MHTKNDCQIPIGATLAAEVPANTVIEQICSQLVDNFHLVEFRARDRLTGSSKNSTEEAVQNAITKATVTVHRLRSALPTLGRERQETVAKALGSYVTEP